jgi:hypothetical protein
VTVTPGGHQVVYEGQVYLAGDTIADVPNDLVDYWYANGWVTT